MINFEGKVALITGASRGIGKVCALILARNGCAISCLSRNAENGQQLQEEFQRENLECLFVSGDISKLEDCQKIVQHTLQKYKKIDFLINNAGITKDNIFIAMKEEQWHDVIDINLNGVYNITKLVAKVMLKAKQGRIVNISSVVGYTGNPGQVNYATTKSALIGFTKSLAKELASRNILCNIVAPGFIETDMTDKLNEENKQKITNVIPLKRIGSPKDIAHSVAFLCSPLANYITGSVIHVNGGMY